MALLAEKYDPRFFQSLPHLHDATDVFIKRQVKDYINQLQPVFEKHGQCKKYGLVMVHRHFSINSEEILVETLKQDHSVSVSTPWIIKGDVATPVDLVTLESHGIKVDSNVAKYVVPQTWSFTEDGQLEAFEFLSSPTPIQGPSTEFVEDLFRQLKSLGLHKILGVRYIDNLINRISWEITPKGGRANILSFSSLPEGFDKNKMFQVVFMFNKENDQGYCCCYGDEHSWSSCSSYSC